MLLPPEFKRLLSTLSLKKVEYLVVGGYAVIFHGYVRTTGDLDIWVALNPENAAKLEAAIRSMGFNPPGLKGEWFVRKGAVLRIGEEPLRFDIINDIDGVIFAECYARRVEADIEGIQVNMISLPDLKTNKKASGRNKDLADLDYLP
jgi:predicted nucleotidyltransferase